MLAKGAASYFTEEFFAQVAKDMQSGRWPAKRVQHSDDVVTGLRAQVFPTGLISYHVSYYCGEERPFIMIGYGHDKKSPLYLSVTEARNIARTIIKLAEKGINVQDGLLPRLIRELKDQGLKWRPK